MTLEVSVGARVWQVALSPVSHRKAAIGGAIEWPRSWGTRVRRARVRTFSFKGRVEREGFAKDGNHTQTSKIRPEKWLWDLETERG